MSIREELKRLRKEASHLRKSYAIYKRAWEAQKQNNQKKERKIKVLENKNKKLKKENQELKSQLESKTDYASTLQGMIFKKNVESRSRGRKRGGQSGHKGYGRKKPVDIDKKVEVKLNCCPHCSTKLQGNNCYYERTVEDIALPLKTIVTQYKIQRQRCSNCKKEIHAQPENTLPKCRIGLNTIKLIIFQKYRLRLPLEKIRETLKEQYGLDLTEGSIENLLHYLRKKFKLEYKKILKEVRKGKVKHADETGWRIQGENGWCWTFTTPNVCYYTIEGTRGKGVPQKVLGRNPKGVLMRDDYRGYTSLNMIQASCWAHLLRVSHRQIEKGASKEMKQLHKELKIMFKELDEIISEPFNKSYRINKYEYYLQRIEKIIKRKYRSKDSKKVQTRITNQNSNLLTPLLYPNVPLTNNHAERMIRPVAVMRKISGGSRSRKGAKTQAVNMSIVQTINLKKKNFFQEIGNILQPNPPPL